MLSIVFGLMLNLQVEAIFISNGETELCLFRGNGEILLSKKE